MITGAGAALLVLGAADPAAAAVRAEIEGVLAGMERAVLEGDAEGYARFVSRDDPRFLKEQENWASELRTHRPTAFGLSIAGSREGVGESFDAQRAAFVLVMTYRMEVGHAAALPNGARASWPAVFVNRDPDGDGPEPRRWLYAGEEWREVGGPGFVVKFFPGAEETVRDVVEAFPAAREHVNTGFGIDLNDTQVIKLYDDMEHLKATVYLSMPDAVLGGWNEPGESIKFLTRYGHDVRTWTRAFAHEYGHVATWELGPRLREAPWWVHEGVAELAAEEFDEGRGRENDVHVRAWARQGGLAGWEEIADYQTTPADRKFLAYHQGHHMLGYISRRWGRAGRNAWLRRMGAGESLDEATRAEFGMPFADLDAQWRETLREESK